MDHEVTHHYEYRESKTVREAEKRPSGGIQRQCHADIRTQTAVESPPNLGKMLAYYRRESPARKLVVFSCWPFGVTEPNEGTGLRASTAPAESRPY